MIISISNLETFNECIQQFNIMIVYYLHTVTILYGVTAGHKEL